VVGGGAVGVACAYELARRGATVTLLEREAAVGLGCSAGNAGLIGADLALPLATPAALREGLGSLFDDGAPFHLRPRPAVLPWLLRFALACSPGRHRRAAAALAPLGVDSYRRHLAYAAAGLDVGLQQRGALLTWETEAGFEAGVRELRAEDVRSAVYGRREAAALEPALAPGIAGAIVAEEVAHADSGRWTRGIAGAAEAAGAELRLGEPVARLLVEGSRVTGVETEKGPLYATTTVVAAGVWSDRLLRGAGLRVPLEPGKGYHVDLAPADHELRMPVYMQEAHVVATPLAGRLRLAGTLELSGFDGAIDQRRTDGILAGAGRNLGGIEKREVLELWSGLRPCTSDGMPVIGRPEAVDGLLVATGHAMIGLTLAPVTGALIAELASGVTPSFNLAAFRPDRF